MSSAIARTGPPRKYFHGSGCSRLETCIAKCPRHIQSDPQVESRKVAEFAGSVLSVTESTGQKHDSNIGKACDITWRYLNRLISSENQDDAADVDNAYEQTPCERARMCICCPEKRDLVAMRNRLFRICKDAFPRDSKRLREDFLGHSVFSPHILGNLNRLRR